MLDRFKLLRSCLKEIHTWCGGDGEFVVDTYPFKLEASAGATHTSAIIFVDPPLNLPYYGAKYEIKIDLLEEVFFNDMQAHLTLGTHEHNIWYTCNIVDNDNSRYNFRLSIDYISHPFWHKSEIWFPAHRHHGDDIIPLRSLKMAIILILKECFIDCGLTNWDMIIATNNVDKANILIKDNNYKKFIQNIKKK